MSNEQGKISAIVDRGVDVVVAGDAKGKIVTKENAGQLASVSKDILKGAATGAAKGAIKGAVVGAIEGAVEAANQATAEATGKTPISNDPARGGNEPPSVS
jgi:hypothetical protein